MGQVNIIQLRKEIAAQEGRFIAPRMKDVLNQAYEEERQRFFDKFDNHPVNKELANGPTASSSIIETAKGGNLYSALGFVSAVEPVSELRNVLEANITKGRVTKQQGTNKIIYNLDMRFPTITELKRKTQLLTWTSRSFIDLVENGIANFKRYLFDKSGRLKKYSRSGTAIQADRDIRDTQFKGVSYITEMINEFKNRLKGLNRK